MFYYKAMSSDKQWKEKLTPQQYRILREKGTERPFTGKFYKHKESGMYRCAACGAELFSSAHKYDSGSGWPSFYDVANSQSVRLQEDTGLGMKRTEVVCSKCGGHLGHLFDDGPEDKTGQRYCINSEALDFEERKIDL
ncbi:MAG: peptide-methionine (R)-S-oxide reductase MsrB [Candidatus Harrisonbacteria bacterium]|nr:peptide-methionine (R)-S-oxide reductase MsrB [Candidatus Harrisonbacteria bacterium]